MNELEFAVRVSAKAEQNGSAIAITIDGSDLSGELFYFGGDGDFWDATYSDDGPVDLEIAMRMSVIPCERNGGER